MAMVNVVTIAAYVLSIGAVLAMNEWINQ